jgi:hypothetical protein
MPSMFPSTDGTPIQYCQRCKAPLPPNELRCTHCGYYHFPMQKANSENSFPPRMTTNPLTPYPANTFSRPGVSYNPVTPYPLNINNTSRPSTAPNVPMQGMNPPFAPPMSPMQPGSMQNVSGQYMPPGNNVGAPLPSTPFPQQQYNPAQAPQPPFRPVSFGPGTAANFQGQPPSFQPAAPQRRRSRWKLVIGILVLLIVLIGGGLAGYIFLLQPSSSPGGQPAANVSIPTPRQPPVFADSFQKNDQGWDLQSETGLFSMAIGQGELTLEDDHNKLLPLAVPGTNDKPLSNFMLTFDALLSSGDPANGYGVTIRGTADQNGVLSTGYRIEFYGDGTYAVFKLATDANGTTTLTKLVNYASNPTIHKRGSVNHLSIIAKGASFTLIANGQILKNFSDKSYSSGSIDFFISNLPGSAPGAQAKFSKVAIYNS